MACSRKSGHFHFKPACLIRTLVTRGYALAFRVFAFSILADKVQRLADHFSGLPAVIRKTTVYFPWQSVSRVEAKPINAELCHPVSHFFAGVS
jgi:hypothetical protein